MTDDVEARRSALAAIALFSAIGVLMLVDLIVDYAEGASGIHLAAELLVLLVAAGGVLLLWRQLAQSRTDLAQVRFDAEAWRRRHQALLNGLSSAIGEQFRRWHLTNAESEVGLLLLKGLSHREIAEVRQTSERTIREQARALYRKAGLGGRAALSAFFLEDLLLPTAPPEHDSGPGVTR